MKKYGLVSDWREVLEEGLKDTMKNGFPIDQDEAEELFEDDAVFEGKFTRREFHTGKFYNTFEVEDEKYGEWIVLYAAMVVELVD